MRGVLLISLLCALAACGAGKEMRMANRAAKHIEKAKRLDPSIIRGREVVLPVELAVPEVSGRIALAAAPDTVMTFDDGTLSGTLSVRPDSVVVHYVRRADTLRTAVRTRTDVVTPTKYVAAPRTFAQRLGRGLMAVLIAAVAFAVGYITGRIT